MKRPSTTLLASAVLLVASASTFAAEPGPHFSPLSSKIDYFGDTIMSRNVASYNNGYDVFLGFMNPLGTTGALVYFNKPKGSTTLPDLNTLTVPGILNTDGSTSAQGVVYRSYVANDVLYVAATQGLQYNEKTKTYNTTNRGQYALFEAKINPDTGVPGDFTAIAQTGQHGLPGQLKTDNNKITYGYVLWFGIVADNSTSPATYRPTVVFANPYDGADTDSVSIYQKQTDNGDQWQEVAAYETKGIFNAPHGGVQAIHPLQVIANANGAVLLFEQSTSVSGTIPNDLFDIHFDSNGKPTGIVALPLPNTSNSNETAEQQLNGTYYEPQTKKVYITLEKEGVYSAAASQLFTNPTGITWNHDYTALLKQKLGGAAPILHSGQSNAFNSMFNIPGEPLGLLGKCVSGLACTAYINDDRKAIGNKHFFNVLGDTYVTAGSEVEMYQSE